MAKPLLETLMVPLLMTLPSPLPLKVNLVAVFLVTLPAVVASREPTFTCDVL